MSIRVFSWDSNPSVDPFSYRVSDKRGEEDVALGRAQFVLMADGRRAIQHLPPAESVESLTEHLRRILCEGRNSCRKVGEGADASYRVKHFSYPVPACGARNRRTSVFDTNKIPIELLAAAAAVSSQVQA